MTTVAATYPSILKNYPNEVAEVMSNLRKGKSKHKCAKESDLVWSYSWVTRIEGGGFLLSDLLNGKKQVNIETATVCGKIGRWQGYSSLCNPLPKEVVDYIAKLASDAAEKQRISDARSPEEKKAYMESLLKQLRRSPGFMEFKL